MPKNEYYNIKTEYFYEDLAEEYNPYAINVGRNDYGSISIELLEKNKYEPNTWLSGNRLWLDRTNALLLLQEIAKALAFYPMDNQKRIKNKMTCSCRVRNRDNAE